MIFQYKQGAFFLFFILIFFGYNSFAGDSREKLDLEIIKANDSNIRYTGRFDFSDPEKVVFDWPGVYIKAKFEGTSCSIILDDDSNQYDIFIDNLLSTVLKTNGSEVYKLASNLDDSVPHSVLIRKRTEALVGRSVFLGFILEAGKKLLPSDESSSRKIEFIGNSITCGYGVEGKNPECHFSIETENAGESFAVLTAKKLNAEYSLVAYSGRGLIRNYADSQKISKEPMPSLYDRTCYSDSSLKWEFSKWQPQVVVINLGTNDFSTQPYPDKIVFENAYIKLTNRIFSLYPGVKIFCICGPMIGEPCFTYVKEVVKKVNEINKKDKIFFIGIERLKLNDSDWGCDWHPNVKGAKKMTEIIALKIKDVMNW